MAGATAVPDGRGLEPLRLYIMWGFRVPLVFVLSSMRPSTPFCSSIEGNVTDVLCHGGIATQRGSGEKYR